MSELLHELISRSAKNHAVLPAVHYRGTVLDYESLDNQSNPVLKIGDLLLPANEDIIQKGSDS